MGVSEVVFGNKYKAITIFFLLLLFQSPEARSQFANGADIGWLSQMEASGYIFRDNSGVRKDCMEILKEKGVNALRFRVWVNPTGGWCGKKDVATMAYRAATMGFKIMLDFHYSDTWADPGHQTKPAAWASHTTAQLLTDIYNHTYDVLDTLKSLGIIPAWVQVGNETNDGMLWPDGRASTNMKNFADMVTSGYDAIKAIDSSILVVVHLSDGFNNAMYRRMFDGLKNNGARWDVIGMSQYPYWANLPWATDNSQTYSNMLDMIARYGKQVMICETGMQYNQADTCKTFLLDLIAKTNSVEGLGVFYWEPECYNWQGYQLGAWDPVTKQPTVAMDAFSGTSTGLLDQGVHIPASTLNIYPSFISTGGARLPGGQGSVSGGYPSTTIEYSLPVSSKISIVIYDVLGREVIRLVDGFQGAGDHRVVWSANDVPGGVYFCRMESPSFRETKKIILLK